LKSHTFRVPSLDAETTRRPFGVTAHAVTPADAFLSDVAMSLNNVGTILSEAALDAIREAVGIFRPLAARQPEAFQSHLSRSLDNLNRMKEPPG
jgi:hypothetical protein